MEHNNKANIWDKVNVATVVTTVLATLVLNCILIGGYVATVRSDISHNHDEIAALKSMRADETKWQVAQHEKRLDAHDAMLLKISDKLEMINSTLERIDQRTATNAK